jgi:hypothetical protein
VVQPASADYAYSGQKQSLFSGQAKACPTSFLDEFPWYKNGIDNSDKNYRLTVEIVKLTNVLAGGVKVISIPR